MAKYIIRSWSNAEQLYPEQVAPAVSCVFREYRDASEHMSVLFEDSLDTSLHVTEYKIPDVQIKDAIKSLGKSISYFKQALSDDEKIVLRAFYKTAYNSNDLHTFNHMIKILNKISARTGSRFQTIRAGYSDMLDIREERV